MKLVKEIKREAKKQKKKMSGTSIGFKIRENTLRFRSSRMKGGPRF